MAVNLLSPSGASNFSGTTWLSVDASTAITGSTSATLPTSAGATSRSAAFTPGAIGTTDGVLLNVSFRAASPTGTITAQLLLSADNSVLATVTVNVADLDMTGYTSATAPGSWHFFKFGTPFLLVAAVAYKVEAFTSNASQVGLYGAASNNFNHLLRLTAAGVAPAAGDRLFIQSELTGAGTSNTATVTMDNNSATAFGKIDISVGGTLIYNTAAATQLRTNVTCDVWPGGTLSQGTSGTPIPAGTLSILELDNGTTAVSVGLRIMNGTWDMYGDSKTKSWSLLNADAASSATSLTIADSVGSAWKNGDTLVITSTTRTATETETKALTADGSGVTLTVAAITNAHGGDSTSKVQGEVGNLNRWVVLRPVSNTYPTFVFIDSLATVNVSWAEIHDIGSATATKRGIEMSTTTGSCSFSDCAVYQATVPATSHAFYIFNTAHDNISLSRNVVYNFSGTVGFGINISVSSTMVGEVYTDNLLVSNTTCLSLGDLGGTVTNNRIASPGTIGMLIAEANATVVGTIDNNTVHSSTGTSYPVGMSTNFAGVITNTNVWRNAASRGAIDIAYTTTISTQSVGVSEFNGGYIFGNTPAGIGSYFTNYGKVLFKGFTIEGGVTLTQPIGVDMGGNNTLQNIDFENCTFGATVEHSTADVNIRGGAIQSTFYNCLLDSTTKIAGVSLLHEGRYIKFSKYQQAQGYLAGFRTGIVESDTTSLGFTSTVSEKLTPNNATSKLDSAIHSIYVESGHTVTATVKVRKGTSYAGAELRLIVLRNASMGVAANTVLASGSSGVGTIDTISGTTVSATEDGIMDFMVDGDGTTGFFNCTDWTLTQN